MPGFPGRPLRKASPPISQGSWHQGKCGLRRWALSPSSATQQPWHRGREPPCRAQISISLLLYKGLLRWYFRALPALKLWFLKGQVKQNQTPGIDKFIKMKNSSSVIRHSPWRKGRGRWHSSHWQRQSLHQLPPHLHPSSTAILAILMQMVPRHPHGDWLGGAPGGRGTCLLHCWAGNARELWALTSPTAGLDGLCQWSDKLNSPVRCTCVGKEPWNVFGEGSRGNQFHPFLAAWFWASYLILSGTSITSILKWGL